MSRSKGAVILVRYNGYSNVMGRAMSRFFAGLCLVSFLILSIAADALAGMAPLVLANGTASVLPTPYAEVLADPTGTLTLAEVEAAAPERFRPAAMPGAEINFGYSASAYWLRFTLAPAADAASDWLLEIDYPTLDDVRVFAGRQSWHTGDLLPFAARPAQHRNFVFPLRIPTDATTTVYIRVASAGSLTVPLRLWSPAAFAHASHDTYAALSVYYGMLLSLMLYNLLLFISVRDVNFLSYVLFVAGMAIGQLSANGLGNEFLWPDWPAWGNIAFPAGFAATGLFGALFTRGFLNTAANAPRIDKVVLGLAGLFAACIVLAPLHYQVAAILTSLAGALFSATAVVAGVRCLLRGQPGARYFLLAWSLLLVGVGVLGMRNLGWLPTTFFTTHAMQVGSALEMLLLSFALADRINSLRREKERAHAEALAAKEALVISLRNAEQNLESRVAERTQALESANRKLETQRGMLHEMAHHDPLTGLANRLLLELRLDHALRQGERYGRPLAVLLIDLDGFKPINDTHGHAVGDDVLVQVARRLEAVVRSADTVARLGGDEFVIVLEGIRGIDDAEQVAAKIVATLAQPILIDDLDLRVSGSVGIAIFPSHGESGRELLQCADQAMYRAKQDGRNRYCFYAP
jgi:diguanylate cyclase (GGDEF)-like protein